MNATFFVPFCLLWPNLQTLSQPFDFEKVIEMFGDGKSPFDNFAN